MTRLTRIETPGSPEAWRTLAFATDDGSLRIGAVALDLGADALAWGFESLDGDPDPLGVPTFEAPPPDGPPVDHPNGVDRIDHVVYVVPQLDDAVDAIRAVLGLEPRRRAHPRGRDGPEMAFYRAGEAILEVVERGGPALWGLALRSPDLDATVEAARAAGGPIGDPKPAVQGGRIATVPTEHLGVPLAIMEPH